MGKPGETGLANEVPIKDFPESTIRFAVIAGFEGALGNISRGKDENDRPNSNDVWHALRQKRMNAWFKGESWAGFERESVWGPMKEAFVDERREALGCSASDVEKSIKATVQEVMGKEAKATFPNFLECLAKMIAKRDGTDAADVRQKLEDKYQGLADKAAKARTAAASKLDLTNISL